MKAGHTPGPWEAFRNSAFWEITPANGGENGVPFSVAYVCSSAPGFPDGGLQEANARLIAAAPELLEALEVMMEVHGVTQSYANNHIEIPQSWVEVSDLARAAIAKATGSAQ